MLEDLLSLNPQETLIIVIDIQKDFLESQPGFAFFDAGFGTKHIQSMVTSRLMPFIEYCLDYHAHAAYFKAEYSAGKFPQPYDKLCSGRPGADFYLIDGVGRFNQVDVFVKREHDPFSNPQFSQYIKEKNIKNLIVTGVTLTSCIDSAVNSALLIPDLVVIVPEDCVSYRKGREKDAQTILNYYKLPEKTRIKVLNSAQVRYK